jgi:hypothetical protein
MAALAPVPAATLPAAVQRIAAFMADFSVEATRPSDADIAALTVLPRGTRVYISAVPHRPAEESVTAAIRCARPGLSRCRTSRCAISPASTRSMIFSRA